MFSSLLFFLFKQKTAYEMRISDWSSDVCSSDLCAAVPAWLRRRLDGTGLLLFDGTLWRDDELISQGAGTKTGRRLGHMSMSGVDGSIRALEDLRLGRRIFIHINNRNPTLLAASAERRQIQAAVREIAARGIEIGPVTARDTACIVINGLLPTDRSCICVA